MNEVDIKLDNLDKPRTWNLIDHIIEENEVRSKSVFKVKRLVNKNVNKFKAQYIAQGFIPLASFDLGNSYTPIVCFDSLQLLIAIMAV
jgi:hypothetical protein